MNNTTFHPGFSFTDPGCSDHYYNCMVVIQARLCIYPYYRNVCCTSCSRAQKTYPSSFQQNHIHRWWYNRKAQAGLTKTPVIASLWENPLIFCHCYMLADRVRSGILKTPNWVVLILRLALRTGPLSGCTCTFIPNKGWIASIWLMLSQIFTCNIQLMLFDTTNGII